MADGQYRVSREDIVNMKEGEVIKYNSGALGVQYLVVDKIDLGRGVVCGSILERPSLGVNAIRIEELVNSGVDVAKFDDAAWGLVSSR